MDYLRILSGIDKPLPVYKEVVVALENPLSFPDLLEPIYREAMKLDDENWHCFTLSRYDRNTGKWEMEKAPVYHIVD